MHRRHTPATFAASVQKMTAAPDALGYTVRSPDSTTGSPVSPQGMARKPSSSTSAWIGGRTHRHHPLRTGSLPERLNSTQAARRLLARIRRDYLDAYSIITSRRFTHQQLIGLCQRRVPNLDQSMFATSIARLRTILTTEFTKYGLQSSELPTLSSTLLGFARQFTNQPKPRRSQYAPDLIGTGKPRTGPGTALAGSSRRTRRRKPTPGPPARSGGIHAESGHHRATMNAVVTGTRTGRRTSATCAHAASTAKERIDGYSMADNPPAKTDRPVWFGGGRLAKYLMLPKHPEGPDDPVEMNNKGTVCNRVPCLVVLS
jgi:hypothetical protein